MDSANFASDDSGGDNVNKSDKLDELRLEVGMIADRVQTIQDFYCGIIEAFKKLIPPQFGVAIYRCHDGYFSLMTGFGNISEKKRVKYGEDMFSICSIRGKVTITINQNKQKVFAPFYDGHHLIGILYFECPYAKYEVTDEDLYFLKEITRFIEVKRKYFQNHITDNMDK